MSLGCFSRELVCPTQVWAGDRGDRGHLQGWRDADHDWNHGQTAVPVLHWDTSSGTPLGAVPPSSGSAVCRGRSPRHLLHPSFPAGSSSRKREVPSPPAQPPGKELSALSWSRSSLYSQWRETGTGATVPCHQGLCSALPAAPGAKGVRVLPTQCLRLSGKKPFICTHGIKDGRLSPWGQISPPSAPTQIASKMQMSSLDPQRVQARPGREAGSAFWGLHKA